MTIQRLVFCLALFIVLNASPAYCAPQGFTNFGWPAQQDYIPRLPAQAFTPTETVLNAVPVTPGLWSSSVPAVAASSNRQTDAAVQPRKLRKQSAIPEPRLSNGPTSQLSKQKTNISGDQVTTDNPVSDDNTDVRQPIDAVEAMAPEQKVQLPMVVLKKSPVKETDEQRLMEFIPAGVAALGAALGREGCRLKAACLAGGLIPSSLQGRDMMLLAAETLVPADWKEMFQAAKTSMIQKQDCSSFTCF